MKFQNGLNPNEANLSQKTIEDINSLQYIQYAGICTKTCVADIN